MRESTHPAPTPHDLLTVYGMSLFPVRRDKRPQGAWAAYQSTIAPPETLARWEESAPPGYGIACGPVSGIVVVDTDTPEAEEWAAEHLPYTPWIVLTGIKDLATGWRGRHRIYRYPTGSNVRNSAGRPVAGLDVRGQGGYVVAPGSAHPSGVRYEVARPWRPEDKELLPVYDPSWIEQEPAPPADRRPPTREPREISSTYDRARRWLDQRDTPTVGQRNHAVYSAACAMYDFGLGEGEVLDLIMGWVRTYADPLPPDEVERTVRSAQTSRQPPQYPKGSLVGTGISHRERDGAPLSVDAPREQAEWGGEVVPLERDTLPAFPLEVFPGWACAYLDALTESLQAPPDYAGMFFLGGMAIAAQKRYRLTVKPGWEEPLPLWILVAGDSGTRKSPIFGRVMRPWDAWQDRMIQAIAPLRKQAERRTKDLTDQIDRAKKQKAPSHAIAALYDELDGLHVPTIPRLYAGSGSPESMATRLQAHHGRYAYATAESDILSRLLGKYSSGPPPIEPYLSGWSGETISTDYQTRDDVIVPHAHLSMVLATQPGNARDLYAQTKLSGRGAFGRFLTVLPPADSQDSWDTPAIPAAVESDYHDGVGRLLPDYDETITAYCDRPREPVELYLGREAQEVFRRFFLRVGARRSTGGDLQFLAEWSAKIRGQCARIAALLHLADTPGAAPREVTADAVTRAIHLTESYLIPHALAIYGSRLSAQVDKVWSLLQRMGPEVPRSRLQAATKPMPSAEVDAILAELEERHYIRTEERPTGGRGRPPKVIIVREGVTLQVDRRARIPSDNSDNSGNSQNGSNKPFLLQNSNCRKFADNSPINKKSTLTPQKPIAEPAESTLPVEATQAMIRGEL